MTCPKCRTTVPDGSAFCLACGTRLAPVPAARTGNGAGAPAPVPAPAMAVAAPAAGGEPAPTAGHPPPGRRQAYALSLRPIVDERLRYRLARWIVAQAPAHAIAEVQEDLQRGTFLTFLALTADEADSARRAIEQLGVPAALLQLAPATTAQLLVPERRRPVAETGRRAIGLADWRALAIAAVGLLLFGLLVVRFLGGRSF